MTVRPVPFQPRDLARRAVWVQARRRGRRPLLTVTATDLVMYWGFGKSMFVWLDLGHLAWWKFATVQLRYRLLSQPGIWYDCGLKTDLTGDAVMWTTGILTEGADYVFELTVTEVAGVVTVTEETMNVGYP